MELSQRKLLSAICHGAIFLSSTIASIAIPVIILLATDDPIVRSNAKESINFHISLFVYAIAIVLIGFLGLLLFGLLAEDPWATVNLPSNAAALLYLLSLAIMLIAGIAFVLLWLVSLILPIFAIVQIAQRPDSPYRYPLTLRFF